MSDNEKKIKVKFPLISYHLIEEAAELTGCSVKAFAANAILEAAMQVVQGMDDYAYGDQCSVHLTGDEAKALLGLVDALEDEEPCADCDKCVDGECTCECECGTCECDGNKDCCKATCEDCKACEKEDGQKSECGCCCTEIKTEEPVEEAVCCADVKADVESEEKVETEPEVKVDDVATVEAPVAPTHAVKAGRKGKKRSRK